MQTEITTLSVCLILHISLFVQDHSARCPVYMLAGLDLSWMWVARTAENIPEKASRSPHDFQSTVPCYIVTTFIFSTDTFWWDQLYCDQPVYPFRTVLTVVHTQPTAQWRDGAFLKWWRKRSVLFPAAFYPAAFLSYFITKLHFRSLRSINHTSFPYTPFWLYIVKNIVSLLPSLSVPMEEKQNY